MKKIITTTITVYASQYDTSVLSAKEFEAACARTATDYVDDTDRLAEWLEQDEGLNCGEVFHLTAEQHDELMERWQAQCYEDAVDDLLEESYSEQSVEVDVEIDI